MAKYKELVYMCIDEIKAISDDAYFTEDHIIFMLDKYRVMLLKKMYQDIKKSIPDSNYQTICLDLKQYQTTAEDICGKGVYLRSIQKVPYIIPIGKTTAYTDDLFGKDIQVIPQSRMKYVGNNKWLQNIIYGCIASDEYFWLKSNNSSFLYLDKVKLTGIFEDAYQVSMLSCDNETENCDIMEQRFPIEESLITTLIQSVVQDLLGASYRPKDDNNNANDDLSTLAQFIRQNLKSPLTKQIEGDA